LLADAIDERLEMALSSREKKADALDAFVKSEITRTKAQDAAKIARLKSLREARDGQAVPLSSRVVSEAPRRKRMPRAPVKPLRKHDGF
jgi:hypothetical protein